MENAKENKISASETASHFDKEQERQTELRPEKNLGADKKHTSLKATKLKYEETMTEPLKTLRSIAHHLDPVVTISEKGTNSMNISEIDRALNDHELIKIKLSIFDRSSRKKIGSEIALATSSHVVQQIGKTLVLYRQNNLVKPTLSNIHRYRTK